MKEIREIIYESIDGKRFLDKTECEQYENQINKTNALLAHVREYCQEMCDEECDDYEGCNVCANEQCPFHDETHDYGCYFNCLPHCDFEKEL